MRTRPRAKADAFFAEQSYEPALTAYRESIAVWNHPVTHLQMAIVLVRLERYAAADEALTAAYRHGDAPFTPEQLNQLSSYRKMIGGSVGTIEVNCSQANASIALDGTPWFTCPATQSRRVDVGEHHLRSLVEEALGDRKADALRGTGHDGDFVLEAHVSAPTKNHHPDTEAPRER